VKGQNICGISDTERTKDSDKKFSVVFVTNLEKLNHFVPNSDESAR
jgi:hypothetical protein